MSSAMPKVNKMRKSISRSINKPIEQAIEKPIRTGASGARKEAKQMALKQQQIDKAAIATTEDEIARKRGAASTAGRRSLISSSPTGLSKTLGGS